MAKAKTKVVLIQNETGQTKRVRIGDAEVSVLNAGLVSGIGMTNLVMTVSDVAVEYEAERPDAPAA